MDSLKDLMKKKVTSIDVDSKRDELAIAQEVVTHYFSNDVTVQKIFDDGGLLLHVTSAPLASEVRMRSQAILQSLGAAIKKNRIKQIRTRVV